jgi:hypothetical protein
VVSFTDLQKLDVALTFSDPMAVSADAVGSELSSNDRLSISLVKNEIFLDPADEKPVKASLLEAASVAVPKQIPESVAAAMEATSAAAQSTIGTAVPGTLVVNIFAGAGLKNLWPAINICAFITYTSTWKLSPPSNLQMFFEQATFFARGDWIPK